MLTVMVLLVLAAFVLTVLEVSGRVPAWASKFVICVVLLLMVLPR